MAFGDFTFPEVQHDLGLSLNEADLFSQVPALSPRAEFITTLTDGTRLALAINTEKAKSEFIIAPVLLELRRLVGGAIGLFSGIALDADPAKGLTGICDFILSKGRTQFVLSAPLVTIVEAKNDNLRNGLGQCIAAMVAADLFNQKSATSVPAVYGAVTTGSAWQFLRLAGTALTLDINEYYIDNVGKILGVLKHIVEAS
jgi:hypothetical protein